MNAESRLIRPSRLQVRTTRIDARGDLTAWVLCFLSLTVLFLNAWTISLGLGMIGILLFLAPWGWLALRQPNAAIHHILSAWPLLALPMLALVSTIWSDFPASSAKTAIELLLTTIVGILAGTCIRGRAFLSALLCSLSLIAVLSVVSQPDFGARLGAMVGVFASKNYFGLCIALLFLTALIVAADRSQPRAFRRLARVAAVAAPLLLLYARSTGAIVDALATALLTSALYIAIWFPPRLRIALVGLAGLLLIMFVVVGSFNLDEFDAVLDYFGKDTTLTGRTFLWERALASIRENPALGVGYTAYWNVGNSGAEQVWQYTGQTRGTGFHFHNTYLSVMVDLGATGLLILVATFLAISVRILITIFAFRLGWEQMFAIVTFTFLLLRTPIEVDSFYAFQIPTILLSVIWIYLQQSSSARIGTHGRQLARSRFFTKSRSADSRIRL